MKGEDTNAKVTSRNMRLRHTQLLSPQMTTNGLEVSVHECPRTMMRELVHVFPSALKGKSDTVLGVITCQRASVDLAQFGEEADKEKDRLLENFIKWAHGVCHEIIDKGFWADFIDPCSGLPVCNSTKKICTTSIYLNLYVFFRC